MADIKTLYSMLSPSDVETLIRQYIASVFEVDESITMVLFSKLRNKDGSWAAYHNVKGTYDTEKVTTEILATAPHEIKRRAAYHNESSLKLITLEKVEYGEQESDDKISF